VKSPVKSHQRSWWIVHTQPTKGAHPGGPFSSPQSPRSARRLRRGKRLEAGSDLGRSFMKDPPTALVGFAGLFTHSLMRWARENLTRTPCGQLRLTLPSGSNASRDSSKELTDDRPKILTQHRGSSTNWRDGQWNWIFSPIWLVGC
jgi:hypothetical protein